MFGNIEYKNRFRILKGGLISLVVSANLYAAPSGGTVVSGSATIEKNGNTTNINQTSDKAIINWQDFSIKQNETVNFNQVNQNSISLNRVVGNEKSIIDGALNSNGQVWLINSKGVLFGKTAKVNTAGILVSTKDIENQDFLDNNFNFKGDSKATIANEGEIKSLQKTHATFIANSVKNSGKIEVHKGTINLIGASDVTISLNDNSVVSYSVNKGVLDALVENSNLLVANGGSIYLTTNAKNELLNGVVNNTGIIEANSIDSLIDGEVILFAHGGTAKIGGKIEAKGSFVETSGDKVKISDGFEVKADKWLIDPTDFTIAPSKGDAGNGDMSGKTLSHNLNNTNITIQSDSGKIGTKGDINVNDTITWNKDTTLTLNAQNDIHINKDITAEHSSGKLVLEYGQISADGGTSDYHVNAKVNLKAGENFSTQKGSTGNKIDYTVITDLGAQGINGNLSGNYVLGADINASDTENWNNGQGFTPIGSSSPYFTGVFDGLGHTISNLYIKRTTPYQGLFGVVKSQSIVKNIGLVNANITGTGTSVGALVGYNEGQILNSYAIDSVIIGYRNVGGLVGYNLKTSLIKDTYFQGDVTATVRNNNPNVGGLVGANSGIIENSYAIADVTGAKNQVGGLVGNNYVTSGSSILGTIKNSYASGTVILTDTNIDKGSGGLVGYGTSHEIAGTIENSYYDNEANPSSNLFKDDYGRTKAEIKDALLTTDSHWSISAKDVAGHLEKDETLPFLKNITKFENTLFEGGFGTDLNPYTITNWQQLQNINHENILTKDYYFALLNNLSNQTSDYSNLASQASNSGAGWKPIGNDETSSFKGHFHGLGNTISDLFIDRPTDDNIGLFGYIKSGSIKYLGLENINIIGQNHVGGLAGYSKANIENSYSTGTVNGVSNVGGLIGANTGKIINTYSNATVTGNSNVGGLVGSSDASSITNSFYDKTKNQSHNDLGTGKTSDELLYGGTFKDATWDIRVDNRLTSRTPVLKFDAANDKYYWAIAPLKLTYNLAEKQTTYNGTQQNLSAFYTSSEAIFGSNFSFLNLDYKFQKDVNDVTGYQNAGTYSDIKVALDGNSASDEFLSISDSENTDGKLVINKAQLDIVANSASKTYNGLNQSVDGYEFGTNKLLGSDTVADINLLNITTTSSSKNVGKYATNISGTSNNYNINVTQGELEITKKTVSDLSYTAENKTYDGTINATVLGTSSDFINGDNISFTQASEFEDKNAGENKQVKITDIVLSGDDSKNYKLKDGITSTTTTANIDKKDLTIKDVKASNKIYDGKTDAELSKIGTLDGLIGSETLTLSYTDAKFSDKNAGTGKTVTVDGYKIEDKDGNLASNYNLKETSKITTANIDKKDLTLKDISAKDKIYDGTVDATASFDLDGVVENETVEFTYKAEFDTKDAGENKQVNITDIVLSGDDAKNYNLKDGITSTTTKANIDKANATVTANSSTTTYNGLEQSVSGFAVNGLVADDEISDLNISGDSATGKDAGTYQTNLSSTNTNYNITFENGELKINKANLTVSSNSGSKTYDGIVYNSQINYSGFVNGETNSVLSGTLAGTISEKNVGEYNTNLSGLNSNNYEIKYENGTFKINKKQITANATAQNKTYDGNTVATLTGISSSDIIGGDTVTFTNSIAEFSDKNAGTGKTVTVNGIILSGTDAQNYELNSNQVTTTANIDKKDLTLKDISAEDKVYDGTVDATASFDLDGVVANETVEFTYKAEFDTKDAGENKQVNITDISLNGDDAKNYNLKDGITSTTTTANITQRELTLSDITASDKTYDGNTTATIIQEANLVNLATGESLTLSKNSATFSDKNAGDGKTVTVDGYTISDSGSFKASNYKLIENSKTTKANIDKANATVKANSSTTTYNGLEQSVSGFTASGLVNGETEDVLTQIIGDTATGKDAGEYLTNLSGTDKNYNLTFIDGKLTIVANNTEPEIPTPPVIEPEPKPEPDLPSEIEKVVQDIEKITNATPIAAQNNIKDMGNTQSSVSSSSSQSSSNSEDTIGTNQNTNMMSFGNIKNVEVIDGGIKMPDGVYVSYDKDEEITK